MKYKNSILSAALVLASLAAIPAARGQATVTVTRLYDFLGGEGVLPECTLTRARDGNLYGTCFLGGPPTIENGTVFKMTTDGMLTVINVFNHEGRDPAAGLIQGSDGNFYGTTYFGGTSNDGTVFKITPAGTLTTLHAFAGSDGVNPRAAIVQGSDGNFYGTSYAGGANGDGTVFKLTPGGTLTTLVSFNGANGSGPLANLIQGKDGSFYGTTYYGGTSDDGTVFKITPGGVLTTLHRFGGGDGEHAFGALVQGSDGDFYGATESGGTDAHGTLYRITADGVLTTLHNFTDDDGAAANGALLEASDGNFYGTTFGGGAKVLGTIYQITPAGVFHSLYSFAGSEGASPDGGLIEGTPGTFYGTAERGGQNNGGTVYNLVISPAITGPASATATVGQPFSYRIAATFSPMSFGAQNLPAGLNVNASTGLISGTPKTAGTNVVTLVAGNAGGKGTSTLTLTVKPVDPPTITSATTASGTAGVAFSYRMAATNAPTAFGFQGNANGLGIDRNTGVISGKPATAGTYRYTLNAYNSVGKGSATLTVTIKAAPPVITSATTATATQGTAFSYQIKATNGATSFGFQGNANGLGIDRNTGVISGAPTASGTFTYTLNAYNATGKGSATLTVTITSS